jgi:hypothetical protein
MSFGIGRDAADLAENPVVRQWLWPGRIDRKGRNFAGMGEPRQRGRGDQDGGGDDNRHRVREGAQSSKTGGDRVSATARCIGVMASSRILSFGFFPLGGK